MPNNTNLSTLAGKRVLLQTCPYSKSQIYEARILEVSPSGQRVKLCNIDGKQYWRDSSDLFLVEILQDDPLYKSCNKELIATEEVQENINVPNN